MVEIAAEGVFFRQDIPVDFQIHIGLTVVDIVVAALVLTGKAAAGQNFPDRLCVGVVHQDIHIGHEPVSYTHLDVYKRQTEGLEIPIDFAISAWVIFSS